MAKTGRNDFCPCGSGKKFKKCHLGREDELSLEGMDRISDAAGAMITGLPEVRYGRCREIAGALDIEALTGRAKGIKFVDLQQYSELNLFGGTHPKAAKGDRGGVFVNLYKTIQNDPDNIYIAISREIDESTLIHEVAHALDYLGGSKLMPGTLEPLSYELQVPVDHLEHPEEFGYWLDYLQQKFTVQPDADDAIIAYLYRKGRLIKGAEVDAKNAMILKAKSERIFKCLSENSAEVDALIRDLPGYKGKD
jgi:hypothetical protein